MQSRGMGWDSSEDLEQLEELGDDAIISQQSGAHPLKPPTRVVSEPRTVVVKDHPHSSAVALSSAYTPKSSRAEATVVIRDRRKLDKMREKITRGRRSSVFKPFYIWGGVGAVAFILGGVAAFFVSGSTSQAAESTSTNEPTKLSAAAPKIEQHAAPALRKPEVPAPAPKPAEPAPEVLDLDEPHQDATPEVRLDELPVEKGPAKARR